MNSAYTSKQKRTNNNLRNSKNHPRESSGDRGDLKEKVFDAMRDSPNRLAITIN